MIDQQTGYSEKTAQTTDDEAGSRAPICSHLDLFSGIGGFALAAKWHGIETVAFCEIDPWARRVLNKNFPDVPIHEDVKQLSGKQYEGIDLITGGYPCQPFSSAGQRKGASDDRHLWPELRRIIDEARPGWVLCENVAGHITLGLDDVLSDLEGIGYTCQPLIIPACAVGARHRRDRVWILANTVRRGQAMGRNRPGSGRIGKQTAPNEVGHLEMESYFCRDFDGLSNPMDRLRGLGNAIVPQVAYEILGAMISCENDEGISRDLSR